MRIDLEISVYEKLEHEAKERRVSVEVLINQLLEAASRQVEQLLQSSEPSSKA
jgi:macrodomain Ter protein organizer (MatP/YcbG family)